MSTGRKRSFDDGVPGDVEREFLASGVGAALLGARTAAGWSASKLARHSGVHHWSIRRVELGLRRPRPALLRRLADELDPDGNFGLFDELVKEAGDSLRLDTAAGTDARRRRYRRAGRRRYRLFVQSQAMDQSAMEIRCAPWNLDQLMPVLLAAERPGAPQQVIDFAMQTYARMNAELDHIHDLERRADRIRRELFAGPLPLRPEDS